MNTNGNLVCQRWKRVVFGFKQSGSVCVLEQNLRPYASHPKSFGGGEIEISFDNGHEFNVMTNCVVKNPALYKIAVSPKHFYFFGLGPRG